MPETISPGCRRRPEATDVSALDHILGGQQTMPTDKGLILEETWRAPPGDLRKG